MFGDTSTFPHHSRDSRANNTLGAMNRFARRHNHVHTNQAAVRCDANAVVHHRVAAMAAQSANAATRRVIACLRGSGGGGIASFDGARRRLSTGGAAVDEKRR